MAKYRDDGFLEGYEVTVEGSIRITYKEKQILIHNKFDDVQFLLIDGSKKYRADRFVPVRLRNVTDFEKLYDFLLNL